MKIPDSVQKRIDNVKKAEISELRGCLCPFFQKGGNVDCLSCRQDDAKLESCRDYYLERIVAVPMDIWSEDFDKFIALERDTEPLEGIVGIGVNCDNCYMYDKCPRFRAGYVCGIKWDAKRPASPNEFMDFLINTQYERVRRSAVFEQVDGGVPDAGLSTEMDRLRDYVQAKTDLNVDRFSMSVEATGSASTSGGGILAKIFGGAMALPNKPETLPITEAVEVKERTSGGQVEGK